MVLYMGKITQFELEKLQCDRKCSIRLKYQVSSGNLAEFEGIPLT